VAAVFLLPRSEGRPLTVRLERDAVVGRGTKAGLRISSRRVSRSHCALQIRSDAVFVRDLGSRNGTFVNGDGVGEADMDVPLGGTLSIGGVAMRLVQVGERTYRPDGAELLAEVERPDSESELQDSPSGMVVGQETSEEISDDSVLVTESGTNLEDDADGDRPDLPSPDSTRAAQAAPAPAPEEEAAPADPEAETEEAMHLSQPDVDSNVETSSEAVGAVEESSPDASPSAEPPSAGPPSDEDVDSRANVHPAPPPSGSPKFGGDDGEETLTDEDAAFDFLNDEADSASGADSDALAKLPGADAKDQSSFTGFGKSDEEDVDSSLLGFLNESE